MESESKKIIENSTDSLKYYDLHTHSRYSFDGDKTPAGEIDAMAKAAISAGLRGIAVTDHCECNQYMNVPHIPGGRYYDVVRQSYAELLQNQERFPNLKLLRGIELGQPLQDLNAAHDALTGRDYDVVIGSLHNIRDHDDFYHIGEHNPTEQEIDNALHAYFAESLEMVEWGKFDTLAHITYPLRYMCKAGETPSYKPYQDELDAVLKALIKSDIALEFNTSRILRTDAPKLPDREVYSRYEELGGKLVTIGADAHCTENIASGVEEAMELLSDIGYKEYTVFVERKPVQVPIE